MKEIDIAKPFPFLNGDFKVSIIKYHIGYWFGDYTNDRSEQGIVNNTTMIKTERM